LLLVVSYSTCIRHRRLICTSRRPGFFRLFCCIAHSARAFRYLHPIFCLPISQSRSHAHIHPSWQQRALRSSPQAHLPRALILFRHQLQLPICNAAVGHCHASTVCAILRPRCRRGRPATGQSRQPRRRRIGDGWGFGDGWGWCRLGRASHR
ncbi:hypothetical protein C8F01DRAFT_1167894, partial [Mycena amicta]